MASTYTEIYYLEYTGAVDNSGNGVRAQFNFQGYNRGALNLTAGRTWSVSMSNSDGPMCFIATNNQEVSGVTAEILTSGTESGTTTGTLEMYPLTAGTTYRLQAYDEGGTPEVDLTFTPELNNTPKTKNLASGTLAESISASTTTIFVYVGDGSASTIKGVWPDTPFYATLMPSNPTAGVPNSLDSEIVKVTAVNNDQVGNTALSVIRGQRGTTAKAFSADAVVTNGIFMDDILSRIYPVGSIYMTATLSTVAQVQEALGGTWVAWGAGRVPVGVDTSDTDFDTAEETGGEKEHTLTVDEMPSHRHSVSNLHSNSGTSSSNGVYYGPRNNQQFHTGYTGGGQAHNNLQPYITCYMYKRTA